MNKAKALKELHKTINQMDKQMARAFFYQYQCCMLNIGKFRIVGLDWRSMAEHGGNSPNAPITFENPVLYYYEESSIPNHYELTNDETVIILDLFLNKYEGFYSELREEDFKKKREYKESQKIKPIMPQEFTNNHTDPLLIMYGFLFICFALLFMYGLFHSVFR